MRTLPTLQTLTFPCLEKLKPSEPSLYSLWGKKLQLLHAACCFLYNHEKYPIKDIIKLPISQIIIISVDLWDSSLP